MPTTSSNTSTTGSRRRGGAAYAAKLLAGPVAFAVVLSMPLALPYEGRIALATFACAVTWWITQALPWAVSAMLPFLVFPVTGVMDVAGTMRLYGQPIFFWIMGTVLMGYAIEKHGVARRLTLAFLALPGIGSRTSRLTFAYMLMVGLVSVFVSDAATIAMCIPIGVAVARHVEAMHGVAPDAKTRFAAFMTLGTFYAAVAGGTASMMGVPHNAIAVSMLERFTGRQLGFFEWMIVGVPVFIGLTLVFYATLWMMTRPEILELPSGEAFLRAERDKLGPIRTDEVRVLLVFALVVGLFTLPSVVSLVAGPDHALSRWAARALSVWVVPPAAMFLLFIVRSAGERGEGLLTWKEAERETPWGVMILVAGAVGMTDALSEFGFVKFMSDVVGEMGIGPVALPYATAAAVAAITNLLSGTAATALFCTVLIPAAAEIGFNPASMAILIPNVAIGLVFPWAGAAAATTFSVGNVQMERMIRVGLVATMLFIVVVATIHLLLSGFV